MNLVHMLRLGATPPSDRYFLPMSSESGVQVGRSLEVNSKHMWSLSLNGSQYLKQKSPIGKIGKNFYVLRSLSTKDLLYYCFPCLPTLT